MNAPTLRFGIGGNNPPITSLLTDEYKALNERIDAAIASAGRAPDVIEDDVVLGKFGDLTEHLMGLAKDAEKARTVEKQPYLDGGRDVDSFFSAMTKAIEETKKSLLKRSTEYLDKKRLAAIATANAAAAKAEEEAAEKLAEAERAQNSGDIDTALEKLGEASAAETVAVMAAAEARAKPADLVRTYGATGSVSTLKMDWTFTVLNRAEIPLDKLRPYLAPDAVDKAIKAYVKAGNRELAGVRIFEQPAAVVRRR